MQHSDEIKNIAAALSKAQAQVAPVLKSSQGYGYKYAALDAVMNSARDALAANGLSIVQGVEQNGDLWVCVTMLTHASGEWMRTECPVFFKADKKMSDAQAFGSAYTYARRYSFQALVGIAPEDDDGRSAGQHTRHPRNNAPAPTPPAPAPQQYPSLPASKLSGIMGWNESPPLVGLLKQIAEGVESSQSEIESDAILSRARQIVGERYESVGGSMGGDFTQAQTEAMRAVGKLDECADLVALCNLADLLHVEA